MGRINTVGLLVLSCSDKLLFSSTVVEHSAHNRRIGGSNPAHRPGSTGSVKMPIIGTAIAVLAVLIGTVFIQNQACFESVR